jgi:hypothetical protein
MYRRGRPEVQNFAPEEILYLRCKSTDFEDGFLAPAAIKTNQSLNRGCFSEPEDLLFHEEGAYDAYGVVAFEVRDIPLEVLGDQGSASRFFAHHDPLEKNYSHSEIRSDRIPASVNGPREPSASVKTKFRILLSARIRAKNLVIEPKDPKAVEL